jgi:hypothetical protein
MYDNTMTNTTAALWYDEKQTLDSSMICLMRSNPLLAILATLVVMVIIRTLYFRVGNHIRFLSLFLSLR